MRLGRLTEQSQSGYIGWLGDYNRFFSNIARYRIQVPS
jgi:hypothetical protein